MKRAKGTLLIIVGSILFGTSITVNGQKPSSDDDKYIQPTRPTIGNSAEFQKPGILQIEYGYDGFYHSDTFRSQHSGPLVLRYAAHERVLLEFEIDSFISKKDTAGNRESDVGDSRAGIQIVLFKETKNVPGIAFAYNVKIPTASSSKMLGTGKVDHRLVMLLSKKFGNLDVNFNGAYLNVGRQTGLRRRASGAQGAINGTYEFENNFGLTGEISAQSEDFEQPKGVYALGAVSYKVNKRLSLDTGMRFGLTSASPRYGFFAGFTTGVGKPFNK
jgi:hypothetical protein